MSAIEVSNSSNSLPIVPPDIQEILIKQDMASLRPEQRIKYVGKVCESLGLNPLTKPFDFIQMNGKLILYATKDCASQLRRLYNISIEIVSREISDGFCTIHVKARVENSSRVDEDLAMLHLVDKYNNALKGQDLANAIMKTTTKAKRRVTLSICGLGFLDESEIESIPKEQLSAEVPLSPKELEFKEDFPDSYKQEDMLPGPNFLIESGKYRGKRLKEIELDELISYRDFCINRFEKVSMNTMQKRTLFAITDYILNYEKYRDEIQSNYTLLDEALELHEKLYKNITPKDREFYESMFQSSEFQLKQVIYDMREELESKSQLSFSDMRQSLEK